jgi:prevent-host-death family protein
MKTVTAADANRQFSSVLRDVSRGEIVTVVSRGKPVATISPAKAADARRGRARTALLKRLSRQAITGRRNWTRDELYES